jgi:exportin-1
MFGAILEKLSSTVGEFIPRILELIFASTIHMISEDFNSYPDHRFNFFQFLKAATSSCLEGIIFPHHPMHVFLAVFSIPAEQFKLVINSVIWALKHDHPTIHEMGLDMLKTILEVQARPCLA